MHQNIAFTKTIIMDNVNKNCKFPWEGCMFHQFLSTIHIKKKKKNVFLSSSNYFCLLFLEIFKSLLILLLLLLLLQTNFFWASYSSFAKLEKEERRRKRKRIGSIFLLLIWIVPLNLLINTWKKKMNERERSTFLFLN